MTMMMVARSGKFGYGRLSQQRLITYHEVLTLQRKYYAFVYAKANFTHC